MAEYNLVSFHFDAPQLDSKRQKLLECVLIGNIKLYLGKVYREQRVNELSNAEVDKLFNNYEAKLSSQMVKSLGKLIIIMYLMGACAGISDQDALSVDLESNPFLNSALQRFTCELYYRFSSFIAPLGVGLITSRHYFSDRRKSSDKGLEAGWRKKIRLPLTKWQKKIERLRQDKIKRLREDKIKRLQKAKRR